MCPEGFLGQGSGAFQRGECEGQEASGSPGVESQQLGVHEQEGVQGLFASPRRAGVHSLDDVSLQCLYAQLTELGVDQPLHSLTTGGQGEEATSRTTLSCSMTLVGGYIHTEHLVCQKLGNGETQTSMVSAFLKLIVWSLDSSG